MTPASTPPVTVAFVCVENAGRSQMAAAVAERAVADRGLRDRVRIVSGGTDPADAVPDVVVEAMRVVGIDIAGRTPRRLTSADLMACDVVVTMGCSADDVCPATWRGDARDWDLDDPAGQPPGVVGEIRDEVADRVDGLLDELAGPSRPDEGVEPAGGAAPDGRPGEE